MNAWSHLPNARHIDRVIESLKSHSEMWVMNWDVRHDDAILDASSETAILLFDSDRSEANDDAWNAIWGVYRGTPKDDDPIRIRGKDWDTVRRTAWDSTAALIAFDDASKYLDMPSDQLRFWSILSEDPAAVLLLPAVIAFERIRELECV